MKPKIRQRNGKKQEKRRRNSSERTLIIWLPTSNLFHFCSFHIVRLRNAICETKDQANYRSRQKWKQIFLGIERWLDTATRRTNACESHEKRNESYWNDSKLSQCLMVDRRHWGTVQYIRMHWAWKMNAMAYTISFCIVWMWMWIRRDRDIQIERKWNDVSKCFELWAECTTSGFNAVK